MSRAILYVRVSTDEQAEKGYSQRDQEERLRNWCKYNSVPEVENDRRVLNVFHGMRRAKKEGCWVATAPIGYRNSRSIGEKKIEPDTNKAPIMMIKLK